MHQIALRDKIVDGALRVREFGDVGHGGGGNERVVGRNLAIIPGRRAERPIGRLGNGHERRHVARDRRRNVRRLLEVSFGKVETIRAWISDKVPGFVESLTGLQGACREWDDGGLAHIHGRPRDLQEYSRSWMVLPKWDREHLG